MTIIIDSPARAARDFLDASRSEVRAMTETGVLCRKPTAMGAGRLRKSLAESELV